MPPPDDAAKGVAGIDAERFREEFVAATWTVTGLESRPTTAAGVDIGPGFRDPVSVAAMVAELWAEWGLEVTVTVTSLGVEVMGGGGGVTALFGVGTMSSDCRVMVSSGP